MTTPESTAIRSGTKLVINQVQLDEIFSHASETYPEECCGLMIGRFENEIKEKRISNTKRMMNVFEEKERYHRYTIDPREYLRSEIEAEKNGEEVVGIYHSHPNAPAKPSLFDQNHAWPTLSYLVVEVREKKPINLASWILREDRTQFIQEILESTTMTRKE